MRDDLVGGVAGMLWVVLGAIGAVLLIACANIANLMLVRADARRQEFAVRAALGAVPARIARELFVESLVLGAVGCVLGLVLAYVGVQVLVAIGPTDLPRLQDDRRYERAFATASPWLVNGLGIMRPLARLSFDAVGRTSSPISISLAQCALDDMSGPHRHWHGLSRIRTFWQLPATTQPAHQQDL